ncbi:hypothetical protein L210DRAFT_387141 [Boletus edulis BED1]|uniref:C2H2-type domain-containing protein n=1 Tax=Boletus edulis BED1 TaxID=1328754 RepID=A0AAD4C6U5_BOLED|nr:hypothetical protein L210DRAFT_387141 [Boletus edulis BED1]
MVEFNRNVIDETEVTCEWVNNGTLCNDRVKGRDFKGHLHDRHGVASDTQLYQCQWLTCHSHPMWRSSLERHLMEQHFPARWACPYSPCTGRFTRESTLQNHIQRTHQVA